MLVNGANIYIHGGSSQLKHFAFDSPGEDFPDMVVFNTNTRKFQELPSGAFTPKRRNHFGCIFNNCIILMGGFDLVKMQVSSEIWAINL